MQAATGTVWETVHAGSAFVFAQAASGDVYAWGVNAQGGLGVGDMDGHSTPTLVSSLTDCHQIAAATPILAGQVVFGLHALALCGDQKTICVAGANYAGQLGNGTTDPLTSFSCTVNAVTGIPATPLVANDFRVHLYPSPVHSAATVTIQNPARETIAWSVHNILGKQMASGSISRDATLTVRTATYKPGMYVFTAANRSGLRLSTPFVVER